MANNGFPICLAGIMRPLPLSKEMTDHIGRREAMKKLRVQMGEKWNITTDERSHGREFREKISEADADFIAGLLRLACTAKAA
ncbi:uncharacterized protein LOC142164387 [Nicotiana tabacum]|uniref:Uncharacterized protein LOC142164387 n=1 Tax=Nicotiana tabacum TaxID=4097 RepID=A0AC58S0F3_TOBAC|nr:uncharacterized protein LOC104110032 [Nicotiana tomentosiformis]